MLVFSSEGNAQTGRGSSAEPNSTSQVGDKRKLHFKYAQSHGVWVAGIMRHRGLRDPPELREKRPARLPKIKDRGPKTIVRH